MQLAGALSTVSIPEEMCVVCYSGRSESQPYLGFQAASPASLGCLCANSDQQFHRVGNIAEAKPEVLQLMWYPEKPGKYELEVCHLIRQRSEFELKRQIAPGVFEDRFLRRPGRKVPNDTESPKET